MKAATIALRKGESPRNHSPAENRNLGIRKRSKLDDSDLESVVNEKNKNYPTQKPFVLHKELHKKTYFNELEKLLTSPR